MFGKTKEILVWIYPERTIVDIQDKRKNTETRIHASHHNALRFLADETDRGSKIKFFDFTDTKPAPGIPSNV